MAEISILEAWFAELDRFADVPIRRARSAGR
jgi:hypothetical protein